MSSLQDRPEETGMSRRCMEDILDAAKPPALFKAQLDNNASYTVRPFNDYSKASLCFLYVTTGPNHPKNTHLLSAVNTVQIF